MPVTAPPLDRILRADAARALVDLPSDWAQAIVADPPYYNVLTGEKWDTQWRDVGEYLDWCGEWAAQCARVLRPDGLFFCFGQLGKREHAFIHLMPRLCGIARFHDLLVWDRAVGYNERGDSFTPAYELILILRKSEHARFDKSAVREPYSAEKIAAYARDKRYKDKDARLEHLHLGKYATNILRIPSLKGSSREKCGHPSQKPEALIAKLIACATRAGEIVLDPFVGSGTTAVCAQKMGRRWLGIENNPRYVEIARARLAAGELFAPPIEETRSIAA